MKSVEFKGRGKITTAFFVHLERKYNVGTTLRVHWHNQINCVGNRYKNLTHLKYIGLTYTEALSKGRHDDRALIDGLTVTGRGT